MSTTSKNDQRRFHRIFYQATALLSCAEQTWLCDVNDLSLNGCLLRFGTAWHGDNDKTYALTLQLAPETYITMELRVSHVNDNKVGFKCTHTNLESVFKLRRLIELNLGDSTLLERDLQALSAA